MCMRKRMCMRNMYTHTYTQMTSHTQTKQTNKTHASSACVHAMRMHSRLLLRWVLGEDGVALVSDPSYRASLGESIANCMPGRWRFELNQNDDDERIGASMSTWHESVHASREELALRPLMAKRGRQKKEHPVRAGLDTAQVGVWARARYPDGDTGDMDDGDSFYGQCCDANGGIVGEHGVQLKATSDGSIAIHTAEKDGKIVMIRLGDV